MKESTMYEYTNSAKDVRLFLIGEQCSEIIKSFAKFNIENGVYQFFSEKLLETAKTQYYIEFTQYNIVRFLRKKGVLENVPVFDEIKISENDYEKCEKLRMVGYVEFKDVVFPDYYWFTLWEIAKAYNKKHGCVVIEPPAYGMKFTGYGYFRLVLSWCKNANDAITGKLFIKEAKDEVSANFLFVVIFLIIIFSVLFIATTFLIGLFYAICLLIIEAIVLVLILKTFASKSAIKKYSKPFEKHCEHISNTEYSRASGDYKTGEISFYYFYIFP